MDENEKPKVLPTREFLVNQIEACKRVIEQNQGAINLCTNMLSAGCFMPEEENNGIRKES